MRVAGLIVAAGRGTRLGAALPKQYQALGGGVVVTQVRVDAGKVGAREAGRCGRHGGGRDRNGQCDGKGGRAPC